MRPLVTMGKYRKNCDLTCPKMVIQMDLQLIYDRWLVYKWGIPIYPNWWSCSTFNWSWMLGFKKAWFRYCAVSSTNPLENYPKPWFVFLKGISLLRWRTWYFPIILIQRYVNSPRTNHQPTMFVKSSHMHFRAWGPSLCCCFDDQQMEGWQQKTSVSKP